MTAAQARRRLPLVAIPPIRRIGPELRVVRAAPEPLHFTITDNQAELLPRVRHERRRREAAAIPEDVRLSLYADCERAPWGSWEKRSA